MKNKKEFVKEAKKGMKKKLNYKENVLPHEIIREINLLALFEREKQKDKVHSFVIIVNYEMKTIVRISFREIPHVSLAMLILFYDNE